MDYLSLKDHVYDYLVDKINRNELKPDDRIRENTISQEMGVSRTPIREALIELAGDGIIKSEPRKGFRVSSLDLKKVEDLYEIIGLLDGYIAGSVTDTLTNEDLQEMDNLIKHMQESIRQGDVKSYYEFQVAFHDCYTRRFENRLMVETLDRTKNMFLRKWYVFESQQIMSKVLNETNLQHAEILELFRKKDAAGLENYVRKVHWGSRQALFDTTEGKEP